MIEQREARLVIARRQPALRDRHADRIAAARAQRPRGRLHPGGVAIFGMARRLRRELAELLDIVEAHRRLAGLPAIGADLLDPRQIQQRVQQHRGMADRQHEAIAIGPVGMRGIVTQELRPDRPADRGQRHRRAGVARVGLLHRIHRQRPDRVDLQPLGAAILMDIGGQGCGIGHAKPRVGDRPSNAPA